MTYLLKEPEKITFDKAGVKGKIFPTKELIATAEYILIDTEQGHQTEIVEHECDFVYYILNGSGEFIIEGNAFNCQSGDLVVIPRGTKFTYKRKLKMLLVVSPPFWPEQEKTIE